MATRLGLAAVEGAQRGKAAHDVEEVAGEPAQRLPALLRPLLGVAADEPHEHRHERQREQHDERRFEIDVGHPSHHGQRDHRGEDHLREVAGEVGLERVDALHRRGGDLTALDAIRCDRVATQPPATTSSRSSDSTLDAARRPATSIDHASTPRAAKRDASSARSSRSAASEAPSNARATMRASRVAWAAPARWWPVRVPHRARATAARTASARAGEDRARASGLSRPTTRRLAERQGRPAACPQADRPRAHGRRGRSSPGRAARAG